MINENSSIKHMRKRALETIQNIEELNKQKLNIDEQVRNNRITAQVGLERKQEINEIIRVQRYRANKEIVEQRDNYINLIKEYHKPTGDKVHEDSKLLSSGYPLTQQQLDELGKTHSNNLVMQGLLNKYATENKMHFVQSPNIETKVEAMNDIYNKVVGAIEKPNSYDGIALSQDDYWEDTLKPYEGIIGDGTNIL